MKLRILFVCISSLILVSCGTKKLVVKNNARKVIIKPKPKKLPSVGQVKHIKNLKKNNIKLNPNVLEYIKKYAPIAVHEMHTSKIPASITLAQGILESGSGISELASKSNNHFGIKCHSKWQGERVYHDDDEKGECFRKYKFVENSYKDHSAFLSKRSRYAFLFNYNIKDYKKWAKGLRKAGYATDKKYPQKLIKLIKTYKLYEFDSFKKKDFKSKKRSFKFEADDIIAVLDESEKIESITYIVKKGDTLYSISKKFKVTVETLKELNNLNSNALEIGLNLVIN